MRMDDFKAALTHAYKAGADDASDSRHPLPRGTSDSQVMLEEYLKFRIPWGLYSAGYQAQLDKLDSDVRQLTADLAQTRLEGR